MITSFTSVLYVSVLSFSIACYNFSPASGDSVPVIVDSSPSIEDSWSPPVNGLQSRLILREEGELYGTRWLVPYLELRNVRNSAEAMEVNCDRDHLKVELVDAKGSPVVHGGASGRSGPTWELDTVILPWHSTITLSLENRNWGISQNSPAMVSTDSGAWTIQENEKGVVFLRATLAEAPPKMPLPGRKHWDGTIQTPLVTVDSK